MNTPSRNRLATSNSPYLLQHAGNPVDWWPWSPEALARAKELDRPIFLSIGYSSCHWCHVMERESFEHAAIAQLLNTYFVPVKVDREERPDLDDLYMIATQIMTGRGGWPNSVWLMPDGRPWYAGTYFPPEDRGAHPGFQTLLVRLAEIWRTRRADVIQQADALADAIRRHAARTSPASEAITRESLRHLAGKGLIDLEETYDLRHGGFGGAPKFPPHAALRFLLHEHHHDPRAALLSMITGTLDAMRAGGIHDHVGGGFHRYATDAHWFLPHFEKMLYDNAQLARVYLDAWARTDRAPYRDTAIRILEWAMREMRDPEGGFYSALDADSEGEEGRFYLWSEQELTEVLGSDQAARVMRRYGASSTGNHHDEATGRPTGLNLLHHPDPSQSEDLADALRALLERRASRIRPFLDDKVITAWNGLMIGSFAVAGRILAAPRYTAIAIETAEFLTRSLRRDGRWMRIWRKGVTGATAYLDDYGALLDGWLDLYEATRDERWLIDARSIARDMIRLFRDETDGAFFGSGADQESLLTRQKDAFDPAFPSGNGLAARGLIRLGMVTGEGGWIQQGGDVVRALYPIIKRSPTGCCTLLEAVALYLEATEGWIQSRAGQATLLARRTGPGKVEVRLIADDGWTLERLDTDLCGFSFNPAPNETPILSTDPRDPRTQIAMVSTCAEAGRLTIRTRVRRCDETRCLEPVTLELAI